MGDILHHLGALDDIHILQIYHGTFPGSGGERILLHESKRLFWRWWNTLALLVTNFDFPVWGAKVRSETDFFGTILGYPDYVGFSVDP